MKNESIRIDVNSSKLDNSHIDGQRYSQKDHTINSKQYGINNASILLSLNTQNNFVREDPNFNRNQREYESPVPKERLLTLTNQNYNKLYTHNSHNKPAKNHKISIKTLENTIMRTGINLVSPRTCNSDYKYINDYYETNNDAGKYKENYLNFALNLKENFANKNNNNYNLYTNRSNNDKLRIRNEILNTEISNIKGTNGLKSYEIPHIQNNNKISDNYRINLLRQSLEKSIKYHKPNLNMENLEEIIDEENNKLKIYMNKVHAFVEDNSNKHPNLNQITKMTKLRESHLRVSNSRYMGIKYDPLNYAK